MALRARLAAPPPPPTDVWPWHRAKWVSTSSKMLLGGDRRIDAESYLSSGFGVRAAVESKPSGWKRLGEIVQAWAPSRIKTILVSAKHGVPYLNTSQVFDIRPTPRKWLAPSKTKNAQDRVVEEGTILVMASASPGRTTMATRAHSGSYVSHHFMRLDVEDARMKGWVYAFLLSAQGQAMLGGSQYASIIRHIEPHHVSAIPIPEVSADESVYFAQRFDEILSLRNEAFRLAEAADARFSDAIGPVAKSGTEEGFSVSASLAFAGRRRLEAAYYNPVATALMERFKRWEKLSDITQRVWWMQRFRRFYGAAGIPYMSADEVFATNPPITKRILVAPDDGHEDYFVKAGWIVMACSGQVYGLNGAAALMTKFHENVFFSHDLIRIVPDTSKVRAGYLLVALTHRTHGRPLLIRAAYGTSIPHLDPADVANFPVVRLSPDREEEIADLAEQSADARARADSIERDLAKDAQRIIERFVSQPPVRFVSDSNDTEDDEIRQLMRRWTNDRPRGVDVHEMVKHDAYRAIVNAGERAIHPLLVELKRKPGHWFQALHEITGENPVPTDAEGNVKAMAQAWLRWGKQRGYIGELD